MSETIQLNLHQRQLCALPFAKTNIRFFFLITGYGAGKSFADCALILRIATMYQGHIINIGVGSTTLSLLKKTLISDLEKLLIQSKSRYTYNKSDNVLTIGTVRFTFIAQEQPNNIYGHNFNGYICDEGDELEQTKFIDLFSAINERCRVRFPAVSPGEIARGEGRAPFVVFTSTAQGYRGLYQIICDMKDKNIPYVLVKGNTKDNVANDPSYYDNLFAIYNDNERRAFLAGEFVNLRQGVVYADFDEDRDVIPDFRLDDAEEVHIGQDLNLGYSKATAHVIRGGIGYTVREFSFKSIGEAPRMLRQAFPTQELYWYPDASSKDVFGLMPADIAQYGINLRMGSINPPRLERIFIVNKLFLSEKWKVFKSCKSLIMAFKTRQFDDKGEPQKGQGEKAPDHLCLSGDTLVLTKGGNVRIDTVVPGDMAWTPSGWKVVLNSWLTGISEAREYDINGIKLTATNDHPVWTDRGWVKSSELTQSDIFDILQECKTNELSLFISTESDIGGIPIQNRDRIECITRPDRQTLGAGSNTITGITGNPLTGQFQSGSTSTTLMGTQTITQSKTSKASTDQTTLECTGKRRSLKTPNVFTLLLKKLRHWPGLGINQTRAGRGTPNTQSKTRQPMKRARSSVNVAASNLLAMSRLGTSVQESVYHKIDGIPVSTTSRCDARNAELVSQKTNMIERSTAGIHVPSRPVGKIPVYNLTIEDAHCYYANGILVSNCDAHEYATWRIVSSMRDFYWLWSLTRAYKKEKE
jgi:hypothetical protein